MRMLAKILLLALAFAIPWEFSIELEEPFGPVARVLGILLLVVAVPAILQAGRLRKPGPMQWTVLALFLWFACSYLWTVDQPASQEKLRAYFQEMMIVWLVWEFADSPRDLRMLLRAFVAGSWELAIVTIANFASPEAIASGQIRFFAEGLDPNDTARFLDIAFPLSALLIDGESTWRGRILAWGYLPLGLLAVLLTASRGGFIAAGLSLAGSAFLLLRSRPRRILAAAIALPALAVAIFYIVPYDTFSRLNTIAEQIQGGSLNDRVNIWDQGWLALAQSPFFGSGAGSFVGTTGLSPIDTAHNTPLSIAVGGGLCGLFLACTIVVLAARSILNLRGPLFLALTTALLVLMLASFTAAVEENRVTWLLFALIALAGRLHAENPQRLVACFPTPTRPAPPIVRQAIT